MREIKFRGSPIEDYDDLNWFEGGIYINKDDRLAYINTDYSGVVPVHWDSVGQYTGLKDSKGNEIYEGDIILINYDEAYSEHASYIGQVKYRSDDNYPAFDLIPWIDCEMNALSWLKSESDPSVKSYEVIGNIYETPELLTEK
ncbi:YopX family protein [Bacillus pumilus]|uniref:YopX family protein n=1 Tax=Bacillus pumilus TaxID=1408 RepID=UPI002280DF62|nr:YopX family protein [Bacillus pumilus]MCY7574478.1 YopX family protein [Bacillus pumilus]